MMLTLVSSQHSPSPAYQIWTVVRLTEKQNPFFTWIIPHFGFTLNKNVKIIKRSPPKTFLLLDRIQHEEPTKLVVPLVECVSSSCKGFIPLRAVYQSAVKRDTKSTDECLRDRCVKWPWYITFSFKAAETWCLIFQSQVCLRSVQIQLQLIHSY